MGGFALVVAHLVFWRRRAEVWGVGQPLLLLRARRRRPRATLAGSHARRSGTAGMRGRGRLPVGRGAGQAGRRCYRSALAALKSLYGLSPSRLAACAVAGMGIGRVLGM